MANAPIPVVRVAHDRYTAAITKGLSESAALRLARIAAGGHVAYGETHLFSDQEIKNGTCACWGCTRRGSK